MDERRWKYKSAFISFLSVVTIFLLGWTTKVYYLNRNVFNDLVKKNKHPLLAFWHGRQFMGFFIHRKSHLVIPASLSKDGDLVAKTLGIMGHTIVRGSSSKRASAMLVDMVKEVRKGKGLALSIDGPRGPYREAKIGIIKVAQKTGHPVLPMVISAKKKWIARKSWDNFMLPKPFSTIAVKYMDPIFVPKHAKRGELESFRMILQRSLEQGYKDVDGFFGEAGLEEKLREEKNSNQ